MSVKQHGCRPVAVLLFVISLSACVTPPQTLQLRQHTPDIPAQLELDSVPFYPQQDYQCGPAALATVINNINPLTSPEALLPLVYIPALKGSLQAEMLAAVRQFKLLAVEQDGRLESVLREVAAGHPVLVLQNLGFDAYPFWHYAVIVGYDLAQQQLVLRSGEVKRLERPFSVFERTWARAGYWSVVVVPPQVMPQSVTQEKFTEAAVALEPSLSPTAAENMYQNGFERWSQSYVLLMGLANASFRLKEYAKAESLYIQATELDQNRAEAWNNLAYALLYQGKQLDAINSIDQALKLDPDNSEFKDSKREILSLTNGK